MRVVVGVVFVAEMPGVMVDYAEAAALRLRREIYNMR
jgi:hypothetical protein